jgi:plastocyanin
MFPARVLLSLAFVLSAFVAPAAILQSTNAQDANPTVVAGGLTNPRGFTWGASGTLVVAEAGIGGDIDAVGEELIPSPTGPYRGGPTAQVVTVENGCPHTFAGRLPSSVNGQGEVIGAADVAYLGDAIYVLISGGGEAHGNPDQPNGIYGVEDGAATLIVDLGQWVRDNPVANVPENDYDAEGSFYSMVAAVDGSALWVVESNSEQVLSVSPEGDVTRVADLSAEDQVPTAIAAAPDGGVYVGHLSSAPFPAGSANVVKIDPDGTVTPVWSGLTTVTGLAVATDGTLYASQLSETRDRAPFFQPGTGSIVRLTAGDATGGGSGTQPIATGVDFPAALRIGPDGALYVSTPAIGGEPGGGSIIRIEPGTESVDLGKLELRAPSCGDATGGTSPDVTPDASTSELIVQIKDFEFVPAELTIPVGSTVIWVNTGATVHTTVASVDGDKYWDSNIMNPGDTFSFTFTEPGTWDYICGIHPDMKATIVVE